MRASFAIAVAAVGAGVIFVGSTALSIAAPIDLGTLGGSESLAFDINNHGAVVGNSETIDGSRHAFLYSAGAMTDLGTLGGTNSYAYAINDVGQVVGFSDMPGDMGHHAFLYSNGVLLDLGTLGGANSHAVDINEAGQVVGQAYTAVGAPHAFLYDNSVMVDLGTLGGAVSDGYAINASGEVTGISSTAASETHAFLYSSGVMLDLGTLGGASSSPYALNDLGDVAGYSDTGEGPTSVRAFLYSNGVMTDLGTLGGEQSLAYRLNNSGHVVGYSMIAGGVLYHAFLYRDGTMLDLGTLGGSASGATDINDAGQIVGWSDRPGDTEGAAFVYNAGAMTDIGGGGLDVYTINDVGQVVGQWYIVDEATPRATLYTVCKPTPATTCLASARASLQLRDRADDSKDQIKWKWREGGAATQDDLGTPRESTTYLLCVYDSSGGVDVLVGGLRIDANAAWVDNVPRGWKYNDATGSEDGVRKVQLRVGDAETTQVQVAAKGTKVPMPTPISDSEFLDQDGRVTVQLFNDTTPTCWTSAFTTAKKNDGEQFKAKTP